MSKSNMATERSVAARHPGGRPRKLSHKLIAAIAQSVALLQRADLAAAEQGITRETYIRWISEGARLRHQLAGDAGYGLPPDKLTADQNLLLEFSSAIEAAKSLAESRVRLGVLAAGTTPSIETRRITKNIVIDNKIVQVVDEVVIERPPDWRALMALGERRLPTDFQPAAQKVEVTGPDGGPVPIEARAQDASRRLRELQARGGLSLVPPVESDPDDDVADGEIVDGEIVDQEKEA